jgi:hypothetical protein
MRECDVKGEKLLFRAIIVRAVKDAFSTVTENTAISKLDKKQARYFLCDDPAFQDYCDFAGVSGTRLRRASKMLAKMPDKEATVMYRKLLRKEFKNEKDF